MKHKKSNRLALVVAAFVACVLALGVTFAQADVNSELGGTNDLLVKVSVNEQDADVEKASTQVEVYRIATGSKNASYDAYDYSFDVTAFKDLGKGYDPTTMTNESWQHMAEAAKKIVKDKAINPDATAAIGEKISGLSDGIYLVTAADGASEQYTYTFAPALVAVPGKVGEDGGAVYNTSGGRWTNTDPAVSVPLVLKWSRTPRYGSLRIDKTVNDFDGEAATFVYHIVDEQTGGTVYENYAAVQYTADGVQSTTVNHIPAGLKLKVTEEYTGAHYRLVGDGDQTATIVADDVVNVAFVNEPDGTGTSGHGIENHFVFDEKQGDWQLDARVIDASENVTNS
ncbi:MAG: hypothetical protein IKG21_11885 [Atopobiaceae bacterium]|nr:hypothetical protein [Atopobiaceae bacterium]